MLNCSVCGKPLTSANWWSTDQKQHRDICSHCHNERNKQAYYLYHDKSLQRQKRWRDTHKQEKRSYDRKYQRNNTLTLHGRKIFGKKRPFPADELCELCYRHPNRLDYHHYDDRDLKKGLWLCKFCHSFAENVDKGFLPRYLKLRATVCGEPLLPLLSIPQKG